MDLVTGHRGFIGSYLYANIDAGGIDLKERMDIRTFPWDSTEIETLYHLAAFTSVPESFELPMDYYDNNVMGTAKITTSDCFDWIVFASSAAVYGSNESKGIQPESPYALSKVFGEYLINSTGRGTNLRFFNVYGPGQSTMGDYASVIPKFIVNALSGIDLNIYGDGEQTRDFVHVQDVAKAMISAQGIGGTYEVGSGMEISINDLAELIIQLCDSDSKINYYPQRSEEVRNSCADIKPTKKALGWKPEINLVKGLKDMIEWTQCL